MFLRLTSGDGELDEEELDTALGAFFVLHAGAALAFVAGAVGRNDSGELSACM